MRPLEHGEIMFQHPRLRSTLVIEMHEDGIRPATILQVLEKSGKWRELCEWVESIGGNHHVVMGTSTEKRR
jgi:hypothetical protein